jgi:non-specific serine/threonine protein kinase
MASRSILTASHFERRIVQSLANATNFRQGEALYFRNGVNLTLNTTRKAQLNAHDAKSVFDVTFWLSANGDLSCECDCQALESEKTVGWCKHLVAAAFEMHNALIYHPHITWDTKLDKMIATRPKKLLANVQNENALIFSVNLGSSIEAFQVSVKGMSEEEISELLAGKRQEQLAELAKNAKRIRGAVTHDQFINGSPEIAAAAASCALLSKADFYGKDRAAAMASILPSLTKASVFFGHYMAPFHAHAQVLADTAQPRLALEENDHEFRLRWEFCVGDKVLQLEEDHSNVAIESPLWLASDDTLVRVAPAGIPLAEILLNPEIIIPKEDASDFLDRYLAPLAERAPISGEALSWDMVEVDPVARIYLSQAENEIQVNLRFAYGDFEFPYAAGSAPIGICRKPGEMTLAKVARNLEFEEQTQQFIAEQSLLRRGKTPDSFLLRAKSHPIEFLMTSVPLFAEKGYQVFGEEQINEKVNRSRPNISFVVGSGIDWFDVKVSVDFDGVAVKLKDIRHAIRHKQKYVKLADGTVGELPDDWLEKYRRLFIFSEIEDETLKMRKTQAMLLDAMLGEAEDARYDQEFTAALTKLKNFQKVEAQPLPITLRAELRPYQKAGYDWLHFLRTYGFGGCLADDMGLGKTVQALALLLWMQENEVDHKPALVIVPRSLMSNWMREAEKFTPSLTVLANAGIDRIKNAKQFAKYDVVLMTYGTMLRDIAHLSKYRFSYTILDEAQVIKNPLSLVSRAARTLNADHKLALTGTPMENTTLDIWSLFDYLNPGLLGSMLQFKTEFAGEIERGGNSETAAFLKRTVFPFILRRTKNQVAPELPSRTERTMIAEMDDDQKALYNKHRDHYRSLLLGLIDQDGIQNSRMKILEGLLRLRQIANHPKLVEHETTAPSAKLESLIETLVTLQAEGHKALIFSQFVQMLRIIRTELDNRQIPYEWLTGQTKNRQDVVDHFQEDPDVPFFLLSLKAGGVGLNLTAADYVIHVDPWWNPAVEMQATDRTHRIGQDKPVFVYKFIVKDTVEDKILKLQDQKRDLITQVIASEGGFFKSLNRDDIAQLFE